MARETKPDQSHPSSENMERDLYDALRTTGRLMPLSEEDVQRLEAEMRAEDDIEDEEFVVPPPILRRKLKPPARIISLKKKDMIGPSLARAAREGSDISPEVEAQMQKDREAAERDMDGAHDEK